ncbi:MAG: serine hydrolase [Bacteroidota bacterium]
MQSTQNLGLRFGGLFALLVLNFVSQAQLSSPKIDAYIERFMERHGIPGAAVAVIKKDQLVHQNYYGLANVEHSVPVKAQTSFRLHSLSKIFVSTGVFKLIEQGKIKLDDPISQYFSDLPSAWHKVEIQHLLTHSSGLPDIAYVDAKLEAEAKALVFAEEILFAPGERFHYNQSNYWLLNRIIEQLSATSFVDFIGTHQFSDLDPEKVFTPLAAAVIPNWATEYEPLPGDKLERGNFNVPDYLMGAAGMSLSLEAFIAWSQSLRQDEFISRKTKDLMWSEFEMTDDLPRPYGWGKYMLNGQVSLGFTGGGRVGYRYFPAEDLAVIVMTNGYTADFSVDQVINYTAGSIESSLKDEQVFAIESVWQDFLQAGIESSIPKYRKLILSKADLDLEGSLNAIGYYLASKADFEDAIAVFKLNSELYPQAWNVWDSLGEGYQMKGMTQLAIKYYQKSLVLNPQNQHAIQQIAKMQGGD